MTLSLDPAVVARQIAESAVRLFRAHTAMVYHLDDATGDLVPSAVAHRRRVASSRRAPDIVPMSPGLVGLALRTARPVTTTDQARDPRAVVPPELRDRLGRSRNRALLVAPLLAHDRPLGALAIADTSGRVFGPSETRLARVLAARAGEALQNADAHRLVEQRLRRLEVLARLGRRIGSSASTDAVLLDIARAAVTLVDATLASLWLADEPGETLDVRAWSDDTLGATFPRRTARFAEGLLGWVAAHRRLLHVPDVGADDRIAAASWWREHGLRSFLGMPVLLEGGDRLLAVLALAGRRPFRLGQEDRDLLETLAAQTATALRHARLRADLEASEQVLRTGAEAMIQAARGFAHDFNNFLTVVTGRCDLLLRRLPPEQPTRRDVELIRRAAARATLLTHRLLVSSRTPADRASLVDLNAVTSGLTPMLQRLVGEQVTIVMRPAQGLGLVRADPAQIEQIILALVVNARDTTASGGELIIETADVVLDVPASAADAGRSGPHVLLAVTDGGAGPSPEARTREGGKGASSGLASLQRVVQQQQGHLVAESAAEGTTTVRVYLPRAPDRPEAEGAPGTLPGPRSPGRAPAGP